jgi:hypothetical protein
MEKSGRRHGNRLASWQEVLRGVRFPAVASAWLAVVLISAAVAHAQTPADPDAGRTWSWAADANVFFGYNHQDRKFTDFTAWESQNWFMLSGTRPLEGGRLALHGMVSLEPFTLQDLGSPQVFQTGETFQGAPLIDYQHPHDLIMNLGATYATSARGVNLTFEAAIVGTPALGPTPFMHRASARNNPQAPLAHHYMDATHITPGVLRAAAEAGGLSAEVSVFRGEEPNENRVNIDRPRLDSWSVRGAWRGGPWLVQLSGAHLHEPEPFDPYDATRITASVEFAGAVRARPLAAAIVWGNNREVHGNLDGYLVEWDFRFAPRSTFFGRAELMAKDILRLGGLHPRGVIHFHQISRVAAVTLGYAREVHESRWGRLAIGGDATAYHLTDDLREPYGSPRSFHVFVRWRPRPASPPHQHH